MSDLVIAHESMRNRSQSLYGELVVIVPSAGGMKLRAVIDRNAYDSQSWAKVEWLSDRWVVLATLPIDECAVSADSYVTRTDEWKERMRADLDRLIEIGRKVMQV